MIRLPRRSVKKSPQEVREVLFLAQLPPPVHGVTVMSKRVHDTLLQFGDMRLTPLWAGSAKRLADIDRRSLMKYLAFCRMLGVLSYQVLTRKRYYAVYLTLAPRAHTVARDALLAAIAKLLSSVVIVHLHGDGLSEILDRASLKTKILLRLLRGATLAGASSNAIRLAQTSQVFNGAIAVPNAVPDPGPNGRSPSQTLQLGFMANLDPRKGVFRFVEAVAAMVDQGLPVTAIVAGSSTPFLSTHKLERFIAGHNLTSVIRVIGPVHGDIKDAFWRSLDVFVYPTEHDYAPLVLVEALSYGVAPIATDVGAIPDMIGTVFAENILPATLSHSDARTAMVSLVRRYQTDRPKLGSDQAAARDLYLAQFSMGCLRAQLIRVFQHRQL